MLAPTAEYIPFWRRQSTRTCGLSLLSPCLKSAALTRNVRQNRSHGRVTMLDVAVGNSDGMVDFHEAEDARMGSLSVHGYQGQAGRLIRVQCRTLDSIVTELNIAPDFIKIDVEGFSDAVLRGASRLLETVRPRIVLEANP